MADVDTGTSTNAFQQLGVDFDQLTPETAATLLQLITHSLSTGATLPSVNDISPEKSLSTGNSENLRNTNICPAWGCKRKFTAFTHGGKSNISRCALIYSYIQCYHILINYIFFFCFVMLFKFMDSHAKRSS